MTIGAENVAAPALPEAVVVVMTWPPTLSQDKVTVPGSYAKPFTTIDCPMKSSVAGPPDWPTTVPFVELNSFSVGCAGAAQIELVASAHTWFGPQQADPQTVEPVVVPQQAPLDVHVPVQHWPLQMVACKPPGQHCPFTTGPKQHWPFTQLPWSQHCPPQLGCSQHCPLVDTWSGAQHVAVVPFTAHA